MTAERGEQIQDRADATAETQPMREPWMRGTYPELDPVRRGVVHALEQAGEDATRWARPLSTVEMHTSAAGLPTVAFHLRHIVRSADRLLSYAEDGEMRRTLREEQRSALATEHAAGDAADDVLEEFERGLAEAKSRVRAMQPERYAEVRGIGRERLPTTLGGLLVHCAEHTQRHAGQMVTTAQLIRHNQAMLKA